MAHRCDKRLPFATMALVLAQARLDCLLAAFADEFEAAEVGQDLVGLFLFGDVSYMFGNQGYFDYFAPRMTAIKGLAGYHGFIDDRAGGESGPGGDEAREGEGIGGAGGVVSGGGAGGARRARVGADTAVRPRRYAHFGRLDTAVRPYARRGPTPIDLEASC